MKEIETMLRAIMDFRKIADGIDSAKEPKTYDLYHTILDYAVINTETAIKDRLELMVDTCDRLRQACARCRYIDECTELRSLAIDICGTSCPSRWTSIGIQGLTNGFYKRLVDGGEEVGTKGS